MSLSQIRAAFETELAGMSPALATAWENVVLSPKPAAGTPYQIAKLMPAEPENPTYGDGFYRERGYFQLNLCYPTKQNPGAGPSIARAELLRETFPRGKTLIAGGVTVIVERTPEIGVGFSDGDRYVVPVRIRYFANVTGTDLITADQGGFLVQE